MGQLLACLVAASGLAGLPRPVMLLLLCDDAQPSVRLSIIFNRRISFSLAHLRCN